MSAKGKAGQDESHGPIITGFMLFCSRRLEAVLAQLRAEASDAEPSNEAIGRALMGGWKALSSRGREIFVQRALALCTKSRSSGAG